MNVQRPVVQITQGLIRGIKRKGIYDHDFYSFEGIPYAQPPLGELRFKAPVPAGTWSGVRDCRECDKKPFQKKSIGIIEGTEDCLYINVFAKTLDCEEKLPVMVWIYGGFFVTGSGIRTKYGPDYFMHENIILVTFNYRLTSLGFLSIVDRSCEVPGNAGLKDQVLALKWVKQNIAFFGGDPENITLFGESAGGASVHYLTTFEQTRGLFHKAICMSGVITNQWALSRPTSDLAYKLAYDKGYNGPKQDKLVLEYLRNVPAEELVEVDALNAETSDRGEFYAFMPCIEPYDSPDAVIRKPIRELLANAWGNEIPMIIGGCSVAGILKYSTVNNKTIMQHYNQKPILYFPYEVRSTLTADKIKTLVPQLRELHFKYTNEVLGYMDYDNFIAYWEGIHRFIKIRLSKQSAPIYQYIFDFHSPTFSHHLNRIPGGDTPEAVYHADDLAYMFYTPSSWKLDSDSPEYLTIKRMAKIWTSFAKTSNPNCEYTENSPWKSVQESDVYKWMRISDELKFEEMDEEFKNKFNFWISLYES